MTRRDNLLVWMAGVPWDGIRGTDRHLATAMSRHARILWVDPAVSPLARRTTNFRSFRPGLSVIDDRVTRLTPVRLPGRNRPVVRETTAPLGRSQVRWALRRLGMRPHAVVVTHLENFLGFWGHGVVNVLYGTDDYVAGADLMGLPLGRVRRHELRALARADVVAAVSPELAARWASLGASPLLLPNGCWPSGVRMIPSNGCRSSAVRAYPASPETRNPPPPVVALVGQLSDRIDLTALEAVADSGLSLLIVGPLDPRWGGQRFRALTARPNVRYMGQVPAESVPSHLAAADVGITPYRDTPFNRASFPLKTLEYLSAGLPVVSADLPSARWLRSDLMRGTFAPFADQMLVLARGSVDYPQAIRAIADRTHWLRSGAGAAGDPGDEDLARRCVAFAATHAWPRRADALAAAVGLFPSS